MLAKNKFVVLSGLILLYHEVLVFLSVPYRCSWPTTTCPDAFRAAVVGDPQLTDRSSYWFAPSGMMLWLIEQLSDVFMKKSFRQVLAMRPHAVLFVGDLMDGTVRLTDEEYEQELARFRHVFSMPPHVQRLFVAGNHDVGIRSPALCPVCRRRFEKHFAMRKYAKEMSDLMVVGMDSIQVFHNTSIQGFPSAPCQRKLLLSHVPLWRESDSPCGATRGSARGIDYGQGFNYENMLPRSVTENLLRDVAPDLILSGDDHDHCKHVHLYPSAEGHKEATEITVGTFSWLQGNPRPSVVLLSISTCLLRKQKSHCLRRLSNATATHVDEARQGEVSKEAWFDYRVCPLPRQLGAVFFYLSWLASSLLVSFAFHLLCLESQSFDIKKFEEKLKKKERHWRVLLKVRRACALTWKDGIRSSSIILLMYGCIHLLAQLS
mmetsp:Transcript_7055/g.24594  ORF Transcript_7055/g.24594 Transcript_7055/m.24594 type:complete len:433 (-) Transcript_7055:649-1947(-)